MDITNLVTINKIDVEPEYLIELLEIEWFKKTFPGVSATNRIDINKDGTCTLEVRSLKKPYKPGNYDISHIKLTAKQSEEYKTIRRMHNIFYRRYT